MRYEISLVNSNILKEVVTEESAKILKKLLIPTENDDDLNIDNSFGVFLGFNIEISDDERKMNHSQFREHINNRVIAAVNNQIPTINKCLNESNFLGYDFYFYIIPFSELERVRKDIIAKLK